MPPFQYQQFQSPYANTIAQLLAHQGDPQAQAAQAVAAAQARATEIGAQAWGGAIQNITKAGSDVVSEMARQQEIAPTLEMNKIKLAQAQHLQAGQRAYAQLAGGDTLPPGDVGPRQPSYMTADHRFDIPAITERLTQLGYGDIAPDLVQHAETLNDQMTKTEAARTDYAKQQTILRGNLAYGAMQMAQKTGTPVTDAMDFVVKPALSSGLIKPDDYAQVRAQIAGLPPEQQIEGLRVLTREAGKLLPERNVAKDAQVYDAFDNLVAQGVKSAPPRIPLEDIAAKAFAKSIGKVDAQGQGDATQLTDADWQTMADRKKTTTPEEMERAAFAKKLGLDVKDVTDDQWQNYDKRKIQNQANATLSGQIALKKWEQDHPPVADQNKLENQARTVLLRAVSARSGTLGREDVRVADANHLLSAFDQYLDPATGQYDVKAVPLKEIALGTAKLMAGGGNVGVEAMKNFEAATLKGDIAQAVSYLSGQPQAATTQGVATMLRDLIQRQGQTAVDNREQSLQYLRQILPTELEDARRQKLESANLTQLHQSAIVSLPDGRKILRVSTDGGRTWK